MFRESHEVPSPYKFGDPVRGPYFYGRTNLIRQLLGDDAKRTWIIGNAFVGKASLFYQLEAQGNNAARLVVRSSIEGINNRESLGTRLQKDLNKYDHLMERLRAKWNSSGDISPSEIFGMLDEYGQERGIEVLLLIDEAEALLEIASNDGFPALFEMRHTIDQSKALRVMLAATRRLFDLDDMYDGPQTPLLDNFSLRYLGRLEADEAQDLIRQSQSPMPVSVDDATAESIIAMTGGLPALIQWLCDRLWNGQGLCAPRDHDLIPGTRLKRWFSHDYQCLDQNERSILHCLAQVTSDGWLDESSIQEKLGADLFTQEDLDSFLHTLEKLCYIESNNAGYRIGNPILCNWLHMRQLSAESPVRTSLSAVEQQHFQTLLSSYQERLRVDEETQARMGDATPPYITIEIEKLTKDITDLEAKLGVISRNGIEAGYTA